jgi:uncharacterized protein YaiE (UPF0345 family)
MRGTDGGIAMKKFFLALMLCLAVLSPALAAGAKTVTVSNSKEFLQALGSDTVIVMKPGIYNLSEWDATVVRGAYGVKLQRGVSWEEVFDGGELTLKGIKNLTIRADDTRETMTEQYTLSEMMNNLTIHAEDKGRVKITVTPRYAFVLKFVNCSNITIEKVIAGHEEGGECVGGVFGFTNSSGINVNEVSMYGSGTEGLHLVDVLDMKVTDSEIYECTYYIMTIIRSRNVAFETCSFRENGGFDMVNIASSDGVSFSGCRFDANTGEGKMFRFFDENDEESKNIKVENCRFTANSDQNIAPNKKISFQNCNFE